MSNKLHIIGIGYRPLDAGSGEIVLNSEVILAPSRLYEVFKGYREFEAVQSRITVISNVPATIAFIRECFSRSRVPSMVLLASGDPLFFGIGRRMIEEFGRELVEVRPDVSSMQEAFAGINMPWDDAFCISVHGGPDIAKRRAPPYKINDIPRLLEQHGKLAILTDKQNNPAEIAKELNSMLPHSALSVHVCERLGYPDERIISGRPEEIAAGSFADPNVIIIRKTEDSGRRPGIRFGLRENDILHERGLITKDEVRAVALHKLRLPESGTLWDIGAGSGSISLEAARLCPGLRVIAVEKKTDRVETIRENVRRFGVGNVEIISGSAPEILSNLPAPERVLIGGSGREMSGIVASIHAKMSSGIIVINAATLETLHGGLAALEANGFSVDVSEISVSRSKITAGKRLMSALNPIFIITGEKR